MAEGWFEIGSVGIYPQDGTDKLLAQVFTDAIDPNGTINDDDAFNRVSNKAMAQTKDRKDIDGLIFLHGSPYA